MYVHNIVIGNLIFNNYFRFMISIICTMEKNIPSYKVIRIMKLLLLIL
jgi:hypothetical protein